MGAVKLGGPLSYVQTLHTALVPLHPDPAPLSCHFRPIPKSTADRFITQCLQRSLQCFYSRTSLFRTQGGHIHSLDEKSRLPVIVTCERMDAFIDRCS